VLARPSQGRFLSKNGSFVEFGDHPTCVNDGEPGTVVDWAFGGCPYAQVTLVATDGRRMALPGRTDAILPGWAYFDSTGRFWVWLEQEQEGNWPSWRFERRKLTLWVADSDSASEAISTDQLIASVKSASPDWPFLEPGGSAVITHVARSAANEEWVVVLAPTTPDGTGVYRARNRVVRVNSSTLSATEIPVAALQINGIVANSTGIVFEQQVPGLPSTKRWISYDSRTGKEINLTGLIVPAPTYLGLQALVRNRWLIFSNCCSGSKTQRGYYYLDLQHPEQRAGSLTAGNDDFFLRVNDDSLELAMSARRTADKKQNQVWIGQLVAGP
jgi:hypothetical protein